eukprot:1434968-Amphidinium_carterae.1
MAAYQSLTSEIHGLQDVRDGFFTFCASDNLDNAYRFGSRLETKSRHLVQIPHKNRLRHVNLLQPQLNENFLSVTYSDNSICDFFKTCVCEMVPLAPVSSHTSSCATRLRLQGSLLNITQLKDATYHASVCNCMSDDNHYCLVQSQGHQDRFSQTGKLNATTTRLKMAKSSHSRSVLSDYSRPYARLSI